MCYELEYYLRLTDVGFRPEVSTHSAPVVLHIDLHHPVTPLVSFVQAHCGENTTLSNILTFQNLHHNRLTVQYITISVSMYEVSCLTIVHADDAGVLTLGVVGVPV